jgi:hypothetical protein
MAGLTWLEAAFALFGVGVVFGIPVAVLALAYRRYLSRKK